MGKTWIEGKRDNVFYVDPETLTIVIDPAHPLYDPRVDLPLDENKVKNIQAIGVQLPVKVAKVGEQYIVVDGRQRVRWALEANSRLVKAGNPPIRVPVTQARGDETELFGLGVSLNEIRTEDEVWAKSEKARRLKERGQGLDEIALLFGTSEQTIRNWLKVHETEPAVRKAVKSGKLPLMSAVSLAGLEPAKQLKALEELLHSGNGKATVTKTKAKAKASREGKSEDDLSIRPSLKLLRNLSKCESLDAQVRVALSWMVGDVSELSAKRGIENLAEAIREVTKA